MTLLLIILVVVGFLAMVHLGNSPKEKDDIVQDCYKHPEKLHSFKALYYIYGPTIYIHLVDVAIVTVLYEVIRDFWLYPDQRVICIIAAVVLAYALAYAVAITKAFGRYLKGELNYIYNGPFFDDEEGDEAN